MRLAVVGRGHRLGQGLDIILSVMGSEAVLAKLTVLG